MDHEKRSVYPVVSSPFPDDQSLSRCYHGCWRILIWQFTLQTIQARSANLNLKNDSFFQNPTPNKHCGEWEES